MSKIVKKFRKSFDSRYRTWSEMKRKQKVTYVKHKSLTFNNFSLVFIEGISIYIYILMK